MTKEELRELLDTEGIEYKVAGKETMVHCPFCQSDKPKLSISPENNAMNCWICSESGTVQKALAGLGVVDADKYLEDEEDIEERIAVVEAYLASRGFKPSGEYPSLGLLAKRVRMDYKASHEQIIFKYNAPEFTGTGYKYKKLDKSAKSRFYHHHNDGAPKFYIPNIERYIKSNDVIVVEGEEDAIAWELFGHNALATTGVTKTSFCDQLAGFAKVYICFDNDLDPKTAKQVKQAEDKLLAMIRNMYPEMEIRIIKLPRHVKDSNDALLQGYGEEDFNRWKRDSAEHLAGTVIRSASFYMEDMNIFLQDTSKTKGLPTGFEGLDTAMGGGERLGEIDALVAEAKSGKNSFYHQKIFMRIESGTPVGYLSRELRPSSEVLPNLFSIKFGVNFWKLKDGDQAQFEHYSEQAQKALEEWPLYFANGQGFISIEQIAQFIREAKKKGVHYFYLDHFHRCMLDSEDKKEVARFIHELKTLVSEENIHLNLIVQPSKLPQTQERVSYRNMRGSVALEQEVDQMFEFWRVPNEKNITCLKLAGARHRLAKAGTEIYFQYDPETTRMSEVEREESPIDLEMSQPGADFSLGRR